MPPGLPTISSAPIASMRTRWCAARRRAMSWPNSLDARDGMSGGMGGSMHMFDAKRRFMGGYAIVGESCPIALGVAYAVAMRRGPEAVICFFGDGAVNQGTFHESLNMAALWRLPLLFVCENNHYAIGTEIHRHSAVVEVYKRAAAYNIPAEKIDGMDVVKVYETRASRPRAHSQRRRSTVHRMRDIPVPRAFDGGSGNLSAGCRAQGS